MFKHSEKTKAKLRLIRLGKKMSEETREKISISNTGKKRSEESRAKYRQSKLGVKRTILTRKKISDNHADFSGEKHPNWRGGKRKRSDGYTVIYMPDHPYSDKNRKCVMEHRLIVEKIIGRFLFPDETIHHINEIRNDNRPENLYIFKKRSDHRVYHIKLKYNLVKKIEKSNLPLFMEKN